MARLAFFPDGDRLEACGRTTMLARALAARGHEPILAGERRHLDDNALVQSGELARWELDPSDLAARLARWDAEDDLGGRFMRDLVADVQALEQLRPDAVIVDGRVTTAVAAELLGVPCASVIEAARWPHLLAPPDDEELARWISPSLRRTVAQLRRDGTWTPELRVRLPPGVRGRLDELGLGRARLHLDELTRADVHVLVDHPRVVPLRPLPVDVHTVGPFLYDEAARLPWFWPRLRADRPVVTVFADEGWSAVTLAVWLDNLRGLDAQVVVVSDARPTTPFWCRHLPLDAALRRSDLVVCTGRPRIIHGALLAGAPLVVVPHDLPSAVTALGFARGGLVQVVTKDRALTPAFATTLAAGLAAGRAPPAAEAATSPARSLFAGAAIVESLRDVRPCSRPR